MWSDWLEHDWISADDPHHQHISFPHPELTHPGGEWEFKGYAFGLADQIHGLEEGYTHQRHMDCYPV